MTGRDDTGVGGCCTLEIACDRLPLKRQRALSWLLSRGLVWWNGRNVMVTWAEVLDAIRTEQEASEPCRFGPIDGAPPAFEPVRPSPVAATRHGTADDVRRLQLPWVTQSAIDADEVCYLIAGAGRLKIGASRAIDSRLSSLRTGSPTPLSLLATLPGGYRVENALHRRFAQWRLHGEWFTDRPEIRSAFGLTP